MRIETSNQDIPLGDVIQKTDEDGNLYNDFVPNGEYLKVTTTDIYVDENKVFQRVSDGKTLGSHITIGTLDNINNYQEINI